MKHIWSYALTITWCICECTSWVCWSKPLHSTIRQFCPFLSMSGRQEDMLQWWKKNPLMADHSELDGTWAVFAAKRHECMNIYRIKSSTVSWHAHIISQFLTVWNWGSLLSKRIAMGQQDPSHGDKPDPIDACHCSLPGWACIKKFLCVCVARKTNAKLLQTPWKNIIFLSQQLQ